MTDGHTGWPTDCPRPPDDENESPFVRRPMVDWLAPEQLASTGLRAAMAAVFGAYADKREVQAALHPLGQPNDLYVDYSAEDAGGDFWFDFAADTGDGFDATYAMAWLLSRESLTTARGADPLPRGRLLVLGGDQVYPTANREEYQDRFTGPFRAALPWAPPDRVPHLYVVPGNHDWYDGLTSFTRLFCQGRWVGGWKTRQKRSYFALKLPYGWWLWGTDIQLQSDIDLPQKQYFERVAAEMKGQAAAGDGPPRLLLCTAQPQWVYCDVEPPGTSKPPRGGCRLRVDPEEFTTLEYFHREVIAKNGIELVAMLSGDLHHYARYERAEGAPSTPSTPSQLITSGGAGAYLYPTHHMPEGLELGYGHREDGTLRTVPVRYQRRAVYPSEDDSRTLGRWSWLSLPWRNLGFAVMLALVYLLFAWMVQSASKAGNGLFEDWWPAYAERHGLEAFVAERGPYGEGPRWLDPSIMEVLSELHPSHFPKVLHAFWDVLRHSPSSVVLALLVVAGLFGFRRSAGSNVAGGLAGVVHGLAHLLLACWLIWVFSWMNLVMLPLEIDDFVQVILFTAEMLLAGGLLGGWLFGLYLMLTSHVTGAHMNEVFSSQSIPDRKNFLRFKLAPGGRLKVHAVGVPEVPRGRDWRYRGGDASLLPGEAWYQPPEDAIATELVEPPFEVRS